MAEQGEPASRSLDIFGVKPIAESMKHLAVSVIDGAASFLGKICLPAAEELGLLFKDKVANWRALNAARIAEAARKKLEEQQVDLDHTQAHPRVVGQIIDTGSWADTIELQELWAGLLASSCTSDGKDESNLIFANLLGQLTSLEASVIHYSCERAGKHVALAGFVYGDTLIVDGAEIKMICKTDDLYRLDRELDHLRSLELLTLNGGFDADTGECNLTPTPLALQLYMRCKGHQGDPVSFYGLERPTPPPVAPMKPAPST